MKIRLAMVSNSSSSSFLLAFDKVPETVEEMVAFLFKKDESEWGAMNDLCDGHWKWGEYNGPWDVRDIASCVLENLQGAKPITEGKMYANHSKTGMTEVEWRELLGWELTEDSNLLNSILYNCPVFVAMIERLPKDKRRHWWEDNECNQKGREITENFISDLLARCKGKKVYLLEFSDNYSQMGTDIEHGDLLPDLAECVQKFYKH